MKKILPAPPVELAGLRVIFAAVSETDCEVLVLARPDHPRRGEVLRWIASEIARGHQARAPIVLPGNYHLGWRISLAKPGAASLAIRFGDLFRCTFLNAIEAARSMPGFGGFFVAELP